MDQQDAYYLASLNEKLHFKKTKIPEWFFELVIDRLEKEWFALVSFLLITKQKREVAKVKKEEVILPEDSICSICDNGECENSNAIVFCDGCNLAVHQDWYIHFA